RHAGQRSGQSTGAGSAGTSKDAIQRSGAGSQEQKAEEQCREGKLSGAVSDAGAGCGGGGRSADAVGAAGSEWEHGQKEEEEGRDDDGREDATERPEQERKAG